MLKNKIILGFSSLAMVAVFGLTGCGSDDDDPSVASVDVSGVASKGIILGETVSAYPIIDGVIIKSTLLGETTTDDSGNYRLNIKNYRGPVSIVVSPSLLGTSKVKCDVPTTGCTLNSVNFAFGDAMPLGYSLEALIPNVGPNSVVSASITPLTHMAAAYAKEIGLSENTVEVANEKVAQLLGLENLLAVEPVDVTDSDAVSGANLASIKYGYLAASIASIAEDDNGGNVAEAMNNLTASYIANNGELVGNEETDDDQVVSLSEITSAASAIMAKEDAAVGAAFAAVKADVDADKTDALAKISGVVTSTTTTTEIAASDSIVAGKEIIEELRTWVTTLKADLEKQDNADTGVMARTEATLDAATSEDFETVVVGMAASIAAIVDAYELKEDGTYSIADYIPASVTAKDGGVVVSAGDIIIRGTNATITDATVNGAKINLDVVLPVFTSAKTYNLSIAASAAATDNVEFKIASSTATIEFNSTIDDIYASNFNIETSDIHKITLDLSASIAHTASSTVTSENRVDFHGSMTTTILFAYATWSSGEKQQTTNLNNIVMKGDFSIGEDSFGAELKGFMRNANTFVNAEPEYIEGQTYENFMSYEFSTDENTLVIHRPDQDEYYAFSPVMKTVKITRDYKNGNVDESVVEGYNSESGEYGDLIFESIDAYIASEYYLDGTCDCWNRVIGDIGYFELTAPTIWSKNGGSIAGTMLFSYSEGGEEDEAHWRDIDGSLTMNVKLKDMPEVTMVGSFDRTGYEAGNGSLTLTHNGTIIVVSGSLASNSQGNDPIIAGSIAMTTASGSLEIYPDFDSDSLKGSVKVNGVVVGTIKESKINDQLVVTFIDGQIETIF